MRLVLLTAIFALSSCLGRGGPPLPSNVGANHPDQEERRASQPAPALPAAIPVGAYVWGNFRETGFYFHGVLVDRNEDLSRVIYADGASEWLPASSIVPDALREEAHVQVRSGFGQAFRSAVVTRRLGHALYLRTPNGDERWTSLPQVRFRAGEPGVPERGDLPYVEAAAPIGDAGSSVLVNYQLQGLRFPGTVTARNEAGRVHVVYYDGESEWTQLGALATDSADEGTSIHLRRSWEPAVWVRGRIRRRLGSAVSVELDDGGLAWTSMLRIRVPDETPAPLAVQPAPPAEARPEPSAPAGGRQGRTRSGSAQRTRTGRPAR